MQIQAGPDSNRHEDKSLKYTRAIGERPWTAVEKYKLKGLAGRRLSAAQISRHLKRPLASIRSMASNLGILIEEG